MKSHFLQESERKKFPSPCMSDDLGNVNTFKVPLILSCCRLENCDNLTGEKLFFNIFLILTP